MVWASCPGAGHGHSRVLPLLSSMEAVKGVRYHAIYDATKGAISSLVRALALEWARYTITVNALAPGYVRTGMTEFAYHDPRLREGMLKSIPLRRFLTPREVGLLAVYLASPAADSITGQTVIIDGGASL